MNIFVKFLAALKEFVFSLFRRESKKYQTHQVEEYLPEMLNKGCLYIVSEDGYFEQAALVCPCGCNSILHLNLIADEHPCWTVTTHGDGTSTLHPSVWRKVGCESHFWFRNGEIHWC
ncbi:MAG: hypothetical protein JKX91_00450 [Rhizobiaceae bacterium]|nr:hypothetical protein [Rhizobiaceae bacterium]